MSTIIKYTNQKTKEFFSTINDQVKDYWYSQYHIISFSYNQKTNSYTIFGANVNGKTDTLYDSYTKSYFFNGESMQERNYISNVILRNF